MSTNREVFPTTQWSIVVNARENDGTKSRTALNSLCEKYWRPVYALARYQGYSVEDAEDITQSFFSRILDINSLLKADREKGKFRTYLIHHFRYFLSDYRKREGAQKRGGDACILSLDIQEAEARLDLTDRGCGDTDKFFDRHWALGVMRYARNSVRDKYSGEGKQRLFECLSEGLTRTPDAADYERWGKDLGMSVESLRVAQHRLRKSLRSAIKVQVQQTIAEDADLQEEMRYLRSALSQEGGD